MAATAGDSGAWTVVLRHRDATSQSRMYGAFAAALVVVPVLAIAFDWPGKWWILALLIPAALAGVSAARLASLRVLLDARGIHEPAPLSRGIFTPWHDVTRIRRKEQPGAMGLTFLTVEVEHADGFKHKLGALNMNTRDPSAQKVVRGWIDQIREAQERADGTV